jgi:hypothetical protein
MRNNLEGINPDSIRLTGLCHSGQPCLPIFELHCTGHCTALHCLFGDAPRPTAPLSHCIAAQKNIRLDRRISGEDSSVGPGDRWRIESFLIL